MVWGGDHRSLPFRQALEPQAARPQRDLQGVDEARQLVLLSQRPQLAQDVVIYGPASHQRQHLTRDAVHLRTSQD